MTSATAETPVSTPSQPEPPVRWLPAGHAEKADLAVLIVAWNVRDLLLQNLENLFISKGSISAEVIVIDNASKDGTVETIRERFPDVRVIANAQNEGFSRANGQGMVVMHARHCLLLNPDMRVEPDALQKTVEYLDAHKDVGVISGRLLTSEGQIMEHVRRFPTFGSQLAILLKIAHLFPQTVRWYLAKDFDYSHEQVVDSVRGSYFAIHERTLEALAGLDTRYFIWFEEVDYCKSVYVHGRNVVYVPTICATDFVGKSFGQRTTYWRQKQFTKSMVQYFLKWHPWWNGAILAVIRPCMVGLAWVADRL